MEAHPEVDICAHAVQSINASEPKKHLVSPKKVDTVIPVNEVIAGGGTFVMTSSLFFCKTLQDNIPAFRDFLEIDYTIQIHGSLQSGCCILYTHFVYRFLDESGQLDPAFQEAIDYISGQNG